MLKFFGKKNKANKREPYKNNNKRPAVVVVKKAPLILKVKNKVKNLFTKKPKGVVVTKNVAKAMVEKTQSEVFY